MPNSQTTLVAVFSDMTSARSAHQELLNEGFTDAEVQLTSNDRATLSSSDAASGNAALTGRPADTHSSGGGIGGWFRSMFGDDSEESSYYAKAVEGGGAAIAVTTDESRADRAIDVLNRYGALDIDEQGSHGQSNVASGHVADRGVVDEQSTASIPVVQEELAVGKRTVRRGGVRVMTSISETPVEEQVTLRDETVRVERRAVDRPATEADLRNDVIEVTEIDEEAVVGKQARVVEEVVIGKETTERAETIRDTVRRTEVEVEEVGTTTEADTTKKQRP